MEVIIITLQERWQATKKKIHKNKKKYNRKKLNGLAKNNRIPE